MNRESEVGIALRLFEENKFELASKALDLVNTDSIYLDMKVSTIRAAIAARTGNPEYALFILNQIQEKHHQTNDEIENLKGVALRALKRNDDAFQVLSSAAEKYPKSVDIAHNLSVTATDLAKFDLAIEMANRVIAINPKFKESYKNLGRLYITLRNSEKSKEIFLKLEELGGEDADVFIGRGAIELINNKPESAIPWFEKAINISHGYGSAWGNLGLCYKLLGNYKKAEDCLNKAVEVDPGQIEHTWNLSLVQLALGKFKDGWKNYEIRFDPKRIATDRVVLPTTDVPRLGPLDDVTNKNIVLLQEQGFGDAFQFYRYAKDLKEDGAKKVIAVVAKELLHIVKTIPWIDEVHVRLTQTNEMPDYWVYPMSLPYRYLAKYGEKPPCPVPYIKPFENKRLQWQDRLSNLCDPKKLRIGLLWAGRETHTNDINRSIQLLEFEKLHGLSDHVELISIQKGRNENDSSGPTWSLKRLGSEIHDFSDSAGILANIDLLISVDSGPVHLAGAMGVPTWVLIPSAFDFRWMVDKEESPWYAESFRLFRQKEGEPWAKVIERVHEGLKQFVSEKRQRAKLEAIDIHPNALHTNKAGVHLLTHSAYEYHMTGNYELALEQYRSALAVDPRNIEAIRNSAAALRSLGRVQEALDQYELGVSKNIEDAIFYANYANLLFHLRRYELAAKMAMRALQINAQELKGWLLWIDSLYRLGKLADALAVANKGISVVLAYELAVRKAMLEMETNQLELALESVADLTVRYGDKLEVVLLKANLERLRENYDVSLQFYDKALALAPNHYETYFNRAILRANMLDYQGAIDDSNQALKLHPEDPESHFNLALYLLTMGQYEKGWQEYQWRMDPRRTAVERVQKPVMKMPMWQGEDLKDKTILLMPEQGYGDYLQFVRYCSWLKGKGAEVIAASTPALQSILESCPAIDRVAANGEQVTYHYWTFPMSLPYLAKTDVQTIPQASPYLHATKEKVAQWKKWIDGNGFDLSKPLIGICWEGAKIHKNNLRRSIALNEFMPLLSDPNYNFVALVKSENCQKSYLVDKKTIPNAGFFIQDFSDTAGIVENLDLLITIDSAPAHLAGAMHQDCWVLLDAMADFRWLLDRADSPWYPSITLYRKKLSKGWDEVIQKVRQDLQKKFLQSKK